MARPVWSGAISFGLISIPIKLYHGVNKKTVSFNQLDDRTMSRIKLRKVSAETGEEVPDDHIVKGFELSKGKYVLVDPDDIEPLLPAATKSIELEEFVDLADIDPMYYNDSFIVAPDENPKPYALLARAMEAADKVAIGTLVMRSKQYVAALRARDGVLIMSTLVFADEIVPTAAITELARVEAVEVSDREMIMAESLVDSLSAEFSPGKYRDTYREQLLDVITRKAAGEQIDAAPQAVPVAQVVDLMAALEASVKAAKEARARHPSVIPEPVEKPAKRAAAKPAKKAAPKSVAATASVAAAEAAPRRVRKSA